MTGRLSTSPATSPDRAAVGGPVPDGPGDGIAVDLARLGAPLFSTGTPD